MSLVDELCYCEAKKYMNNCLYKRIFCSTKCAFFLCLLCVATLLGCGNQGDNAIGGSSKQVSQENELLKFWDDFESEKVNLEMESDKVESRLVDFIIHLDELSSDEVTPAINRALDKVKGSPLVFQFFVEKLNERLYNPNSVLRNDFYYSKVLNYLISSEMVKEIDKIKYRSKLTLVRQNLPGAVANNFDFIQSNGEKGDLHSVKGAYKIVVFYDPFCNNCKVAMLDLMAIDELLRRTKETKITILTLCAVGEKADWLQYEAELPEGWINGYNAKEEIIRESLYDLKAFPTFYLIGKDNRVLLKDVELDRLVKYIGGGD